MIYIYFNLDFSLNSSSVETSEIIQADIILN